MTGKIGIELGLGWFPDYPDFRDFTQERDQVNNRLKKLDQKPIREMVEQVGLLKTSGRDLPTSQDLRRWCPPIENQRSLGSCTANAGVALVEYYERRACGKHIDASRLFLYKTTRNLLHWTGDTGAFLRTTMAAMALFGVPPEEYWPYNITEFEKEPPAFCYAFAQNYQSLQYFRLDPPNISRELLLKRIKAYLASGLPSMFGFTVFNSIEQAGDDGKIPFPSEGDRAVGGHAVVAVGYDDGIKIVHSTTSRETTGALMIRNSWGPEWGESGYGWLPYDYVLTGLAIDWWTLLRSEWIDTGNFGL
jgi:C1A family cysteine protease